MKLFSHALFIFLFVGKVSAQISGTVSVPGTYSSIASAIADLNMQGVNGALTVQISAGYTETAIPGGFSLQATGTALNPITFMKSGSGANPLVVAYTGGTCTPSTAQQDGIWRLIGCDYITIDGIDLFDPNTTNPSTMEFGYGLFKSNVTNGCRFNTIKNCVITLNRVNSPLGSGTASEGSRGIDMVNATTSAHTTALTITTAFGANSYNSFLNNLIQNCNIGIAMIGFVETSPFAFTDQYNDVGGLSAVTGNTIVNYGGGSDPTSAPASGVKTLAQYFVNISNNIINNNNGGGVDHYFRLYGVFSQAALSANVSITNNTISVKGSTGNFTTTGIENAAGATPAGNTVQITGNKLLNCVYTATSTSSGTFYGIRNFGANSTVLMISNNTFSNSSSSDLAGSYVCIVNTGAAISISINNNIAGDISLTTPSSFGSFGFISNTGGASSGTVSIIANTLQAISFGAGSSKTFYNITNGGPTTSSRNFITGNIINNVTVSTSNSAYLFQNTSNTANALISGNIIVGGFSKTLSGGTVYGYHNNSISSSGMATITANDFSNISLVGTTNFFGMYHSTTTNHSISVTGNTVSNVSNGTGSLTGILIGSVLSSTIQNNIVKNFSTGGGINGMNVSAASGTLTVCDNVISSLTCTGASTVNGLVQGGGPLNNIFRNKIYDLSGNNAASEVNGLVINGGNTSNVYNNIIGDLRAPLANNWNVINGIRANSGFSLNIYYNTVRINASSSGFDFGTSAIYASISPTLNLRNNIFINLSSANGSGYTVAYRRSTIGLTSYGAVSNNNLFYAGTPSSSNLIFSDATNFMQTLAAYKTFVGARDVASVTENTSFLSTVGTSGNFLHINPLVVSVAESNAINISGISEDYDTDIRFGNAGYPGGGTSPDIGADEYETIYPNCTAAIQPTITSALSATLCVGQSASFTREATPVAPGIQNLWQIGTSSGGPYTVVASGSLSTYTSPTLSPGTYYYSLANTCTITSQTLVSSIATVVVYPYPIVSASTATSTICSGNAVQLTASGANSYTWSPSTGLSSVNGNTVLASPSSTITYVVSGSNPGGCIGSTNTATVVVNVIPAPGSLSVSASPSLLCQGGSVNMQAVATSSVYTVTPISFSPVPTPTSGVGTLCSNGNMITSNTSGWLDDGNWYILPLPFSFRFFGTPYTGCAVSTNGFLTLGSTVPNTYNGFGQTLPAFSAGRPCIGAVYGNLDFANTGTINVFTSGVTPNRRYVVNFLNARYQTSNSGTVTTQVILYETTNIIEVHTTRNTAQFAAVEGIQDASGSVAYVVPGRNNTTFNITNDAYRWSPTITYAWLPATNLSSTTSSVTVASNVQSNIVYTVSATAVDGCVMSRTVGITVNPSPTLSISGSTTEICAGASVSLSASGANSYNWSTGAGTSSIVVNPTISTVYNVSGTHTLNSCSGNSGFLVTVYPNPTITVAGNPFVCTGQSTTLTANGADNYLWSDASTSGTIVLAPSTNTIYSVTGTSTLGGCIGTEIKTITVYPNPTLSIIGSSVICSGKNASLSAFGANSYSWQTGANTQSIFPTVLVNTAFSVIGTNSLGGCTGTAIHSVLVNPSPTLSVLGSTVICAGQSAVLTVSGANTYLWSTGGTSPVITVAPAGTTIYTVTGTNSSNGCSATGNAQVSIVNPPAINISGNKAICPGANANLTASGANNYLWSNGSSQPMISVSPTITTTYSVTGVAGPGCIGSAAVVVTVHPLPSAIISASPSGTICVGESAELTAVMSNGNSMIWSTGAVGSVVQVSPLSSTIYSVQMSSSATTCTANVGFQLVVDPCTGIIGEISTNKLTVYPNPFSSEFHIQQNDSESVQVELIDPLGRTLYVGTIYQGINTFDMSGYKKGVYYLKVHAKQNEVIKLLMD